MATKKFGDYTEDEQASLGNELTSIASEIDHKQKGDKRKNINEEALGLCHNCQYLSCAKTEFGNTLAKCTSFQCVLDGRDKIVTCTDHELAGQLTMWQMQDMAYIINPGKKDKAGF